MNTKSCIFTLLVFMSNLKINLTPGKKSILYFMLKCGKMAYSLRERLRIHKDFTKDHYFYINYHKFSIKSYVLDVY